MVSKIVISVFAAFAISLFVLTISLYFYQFKILDNVTIATDPETYEMEKKFYDQNFTANQNVIFLVGSSHIIGLNTTYIENYLSKDNLSYSVYNLAIGADHPIERLDTVNMIISARPKVVVYGVADRDFVSSIPISNGVSKTFHNVLPDPHNIFLTFVIEMEKSFHLNLNFLASPKITTLRAAQDILSSQNATESADQWYPYPNTPFEKIGSINTVTKSKNYLDNLLASMNQVQFNQVASPFKQIPAPDKNENLIALKEFASKLHQNGIKVIVFVTPQNRLYIDAMPEEYKNSFYSIVDDLSQDPDIKFYSLFDKYTDLNIWADLNHVAINGNATIYPSDISKMIEREIG